MAVAKSRANPKTSTTHILKLKNAKHLKKLNCIPGI